jgi:hypothetical protein
VLDARRREAAPGQRQRRRLRRAGGEDDLRPSAPNAAATCARARSSTARAARPSAWTEEGFPAASMAATIAARASGRSGAVAFQSR